MLHAGQLFDRVAEQAAGGGIGEDDPAARVGDDQRVGIGVEEGAEDAVGLRRARAAAARRVDRRCPWPAHQRPLTGGTRM